MSFRPKTRSFLPLVLLLWIAGLLAAMQFAKIAVPFAEVRTLYPLAVERHGWLLSLVSLVGAMMGIVAGSLVGRIGAKRMLLSGLAVGGLTSLWQATGLDFNAMLLSRIVEGASHLAIVVAAPTLIVAVAPKPWQGAAMALWSTFFGVGFALLAMVAPTIVDSVGPKALFVAHGFAMVAITLTLAAALGRSSSDQNPLGNKRGAARSRNTERTKIATMFSAHVRAYSSPSIAIPAIGWLFYTLTFVALLAIIPDLLPSGGAQATATAMPLISIAVSLLAVPLLIRHLGASGVVVLGFTLAIGMLALPLLGAGLPTSAITLFAALGLVQGASFATVPELNREPTTQALAYGAMAQTGNVGNLLGTPLLLSLLSHGGNEILFPAVAMLYLAGIAVHVGFGTQR